MHNWVQDIMTSDESFVQQYQEHLQNSLDNHLISILLRRWPLLAPLFPIVPPTNHYSSHKDEEYRYWKFCPTFMRTAATINFPLLYFLDDFQWMEQSSFRWILDVLSGPPYQGACFVIAYNPNDEVELMERCSPQRKIEELKSKENINIIEMSIDNLDEASMGDWLTDYLETNPKNTETIRNILYSQTHGNPLFIKEVLQDIPSNSYLVLDKPNELSWIIQNRHITQDVGCECVCDYLSTRLLRYTTKLLEALYYAACLGYRFQEKHLSHVLSDTVLPHLQNAVNLGILTLETVGTIHPKCPCNKDNENLENQTYYRFVHNSMHQAVIKLIGGKDAIQYIHFTIARKLLEAINESELQNDLLFVMSHVMKGSHCIPREDMNQYAYLALEAARKAVLLASFDSAKRSIDFAVHMLCEQSWDDNYSTTLSIYHAAAEISYAGGDFDYMETMIHKILNHAHPDDRIQAYCTKIYMMGSSTNQQSEAIKIGLQILQQLGEHFPKVPKRKHVLLSLMRTKLMLRGKSTEMLLRLPIMVEGHHEKMILNLLNVLIPSALLMKPYLVPLLVLRMIHISLQKGLSPVSCVAFAFYGVILAGGNFPVASLVEGAQMGDLSLKMLDRFQSKSYVPRVYAAVYGFLPRRMQPTHLPVEQLLCGYRVALETGDIEVRDYFLNLNATPEREPSLTSCLVCHGKYFSVSLQSIRIELPIEKH
jgi:predicted ATPase